MDWLSILRAAGCADMGCRVAFVPVGGMGRRLTRLEHLQAGSAATSMYSPDFHAVTFAGDVEAHPDILLEYLQGFHVTAPPDTR